MTSIIIRPSATFSLRVNVGKKKLNDDCVLMKTCKGHSIFFLNSLQSAKIIPAIWSQDKEKLFTVKDEINDQFILSPLRVCPTVANTFS